MAEPLLLDGLRAALRLLLLAAAPPLLAAALTGVLLQLFAGRLRHGPALTLPCTLAGGLTLALCAPWIGQELVRFLSTILLTVPRLGR